VIYIEFIVFGGLLGLTANLANLKPTDAANMTNTFATVSGVLLGLYLVIKVEPEKRSPIVTQLLLFSIMISLVSSLSSLGQLSNAWITFIISALFFEASTVYFVLETELLGPFRKKK